MINTKSEEQGLAHQEGKDRRFLRPDQLKRLYKRHLQAAYLRSGASLFMWLFILGPYLYGVIDIDSFRGASASVAFIVLLNIPTLWALKHINRWWTYEFCSLFINLLEVIGYTAVIYFMGGLRAAYMIPIYTVIIF